MIGNVAILPRKKKSYDLYDIVSRSDDRDVDRLYRRAMKKAAREQEELIKKAKKIREQYNSRDVLYLGLLFVEFLFDGFVGFEITNIIAAAGHAPGVNGRFMAEPGWK